MGHDTHALVGAYVLDAVLDTERAVVERHLADCVPCAREVAELRAAAARLGLAMGTGAPPPRLKAVVLTAAHGTRQARWGRWGRRRG